MQGGEFNCRRAVPIKHLPAPKGAYQRCPPFRARVIPGRSFECGLPTVQRAELGDCLPFDPFPFDQNGLAEVDVGGCQVGYDLPLRY
jgi:hypothetical protein